MNRRAFLTAFTTALAGAGIQAQVPQPCDLACEPITGWVIADGTLTAADHEVEDGYFTVGGLTLAVAPANVARLTLRDHLNSAVQVVIRPASHKPINPRIVR